MRIGIIGAGQVGANLAYSFVRIGHTVKIANSRGPETLSEIASLTGATAVPLAEAVKDADLVVLSIPFKRIPDLPKGLFAGVPAATPVIDTNNYYPEVRDGKIEAVEAGMVESAWVAAQIGHPVIKVFNNIGERLATVGVPPGTPGRIALPVAGDDAKAKALVMGLVDAISFDPVDAGTIAESWHQQPGCPGYGKDNDRASWIRDLAATDRAALPGARKAMTELILAYQAQKATEASPLAWLKARGPAR